MGGSTVHALVATGLPPITPPGPLEYLSPASRRGGAYIDAPDGSKHLLRSTGSCAFTADPLTTAAAIDTEEAPTHEYSSAHGPMSTQSKQAAPSHIPFFNTSTAKATLVSIQSLLNPIQSPPPTVPHTKGPVRPFICPHCSKGFPRQCDLNKHINNHTKRRKCEFCEAGGAETKDLNRHMWARHPSEARNKGLRGEDDRCPVCEYSGRKDNVKRHRNTKGH